MAIPRLRSYTGPAILSYGFRPFFLLGALYAGLSILFWLPVYTGHAEPLTAFAPVDWHIHEMLFGYLPAVATGFLLTAIPNWTGRLPVQGTPLLALVVLWLAGRMAIYFSGVIGWQLAAIIDCAFLAAVAAAAATEIVAGKNWRNLKVLLPVSALFVANAAFHLEAQLNGLSDVSRRLGIAAGIVLVLVIGGRIIPSFTRNWLVRENPGRLPAPFDRFDAGAIVFAVLAFALWVISPDSLPTAAAMAAAGVLHLVRLARWAGDRTLRDPLVLILHLAYLWIPIGFLLAAATVVFPDTVTSAAAFHAFGTGAIGAMTLAVMVRAGRGHTGRALVASKGDVVVFTAVLLGALIRVVAAVGVPATALIHLSGTLWSLAFVGYAVLHASALVSPRPR